jgi:hypothetical protein
MHDTLLHRFFLHPYTLHHHLLPFQIYLLNTQLLRHKLHLHQQHRLLATGPLDRHEALFAITSIRLQTLPLVWSIAVIDLQFPLLVKARKEFGAQTEFDNLALLVDHLGLLRRRSRCRDFDRRNGCAGWTGRRSGGWAR